MRENKEEHSPQKIHKLVEIQAQKNPSKIAIVFHKKTLTYQELNTKANKFARFLIASGVKPGEVVPIVSNKTPDILVAMLGILKAGAAYSPLNSESPNKYIESVIKETKAKFACIEEISIDRFNLNGVTKLNICNMDNYIRSFSNKNQKRTNPLDLAYVIYTSGTTGNPKGGMISHANLLSTYLSWEEAYNLSNEDNHLQMAPVAFDVFTGDWIRALCSGATLILCPKETLLDSEKLYRLIEQEKINCAEFVPSVLRPLMNLVQKKSYNLMQFRLLVCGSDQWTMGEYRLVKKLCGEKTRIVGSYGLTETTIDSTLYEEEPSTSPLSDFTIVPIGKPFKHANIYIMDEIQELISGDRIGEIYIGGAGVGLGYWNQPKLTAEKFITRMTSKGVLERLYRTGDQGRKLADGNFLFLGRNQEHIKIHGKRVDIPSLEAVLNQHPKINFSIVIPTRKTDNDEVILKCFLLLKEDSSINFDELADHIRKELPCYYIPREFYQVESIPVSSNGKVDRRIPSQKIIKKIKSELTNPENTIQQYLTNLWKELLGVEELGIHNSFYNLGGSSLLYVSMLDRVNKHYGINLLSNSEFETIAEISKSIQKAQSLDLSNIKKTADICFNFQHSRKFFQPITYLPYKTTKPMTSLMIKPSLPGSQKPSLVSSSNFFGNVSQHTLLKPIKMVKTIMSLALRKGK